MKNIISTLLTQGRNAVPSFKSKCVIMVAVLAGHFFGCVRSEAACSSNVTVSIGIGSLNGNFSVSLNGATASISDNQTNCYGGIKQASTSADLAPNNKYAISGSWNNQCALYDYPGVSVSNGCMCYVLMFNAIYIGSTSNGSLAGEVMLMASNRVLFGSNPLVPDGESTTMAYPEDLTLLGSNIVWSIEGDALGCKILPPATGPWCTIQSGTNEGTITVRAEGSTGCEAIGYLDLKKCSGCSSGCEVGEGDASLGSVDYSIKLGSAGVSGSAGEIHIKGNRASMDLYSPRSIFYNYFSTNVHVIRDAGGGVRQVRAPQVMVNVVSNSTLQYTIDLYYLTNLTGFTNGLYTVSGTPFSTFTVENPDGTGGTSNRVRITESRGGNTRVADYAVTNGNWHLTTGNGLKVETESTTVAGSIRTVTREIRSGSGTLLSVTTKKHETFAWGEGLIEEVRGTGPSAWTNTHTYNTNGMMRQTTRGDGSWEIYEHDSQWRVVAVYSSWLNQAPTTNASLCRKLEHSYDSSVVSGSGDVAGIRPHVPRRTIEYVTGTEVSRRYNVQYRLSATGELLTKEIRCQTAGAAWNASDNTVTYTLHYAGGSYHGRPRVIVHPDRNFEYFSYEAGANGSVIATHQSGRGSFGEFQNYLDGVTNYVLSIEVGFGTESAVTTDALGAVVARTNRMIYGAFWPEPAYRFDTGWEVSSGFDDSRRPTRTDYMDGTFTLTDYGCCGVQTFTNREGTVTAYGVDVLKRRTTTTSDGITHSNVFDAAGDVLATVRYGTDNSMITTSSSVFDTAGNLVVSTDALNNTTVYTNYFDGSGYLVRKTTYPDTSTRIERYHRDGSLYDVGGTAAAPVTYAYGATNDSAGRLFVVEQKSATEWTLTINTMLGQHHKTIHAAASAPYPYSQSIYDSGAVWGVSSGKRIKLVDPDGNVTLFSEYDGFVDDYENEKIYTDSAVDVDRNDTIDHAGTDRVTRSQQEVSIDSIFPGYSESERRRTIVWATDGSGTATDVSIIDRSPDGLRTLQTQNGLTSSTWTVYAGGGTRYLTNTAPDGTYTVNTYQDGRIVSSRTIHDALGTLQETTYGYDTHGRRSSQTDVATGTVTSWIFDSADRVVTNTVTASGVAAQTTVNFHDERGRVWRTLLPDGTSVTNEFYTTGLLKKTTGSRAYPVQYGHDAQGRMTNMTTWQDYATGAGAAVTTWQHDAYRGFMTNKLYADGNGTGYAYTNSGRLVKRTWARGVSAEYGYNNAGDLSVVNYSDTTPDVAFTYNRRGLQATAAQGTTNTTFLYGTAGNLLSESYSGGPLSGLMLTNSYDAFLRRTNLALKNGSTTLLSHGYAYDDASRLFSVSDGTNSASYRYLTNSGIVSQIAFTNATSLRMITTRQFDGLNRLTNTVSSNATAVVISAHGYQYNAANQRTLTTREDGSYWVYQYDSLGQVTSGKKYWSDGTPVAGQQFEYGFDDIGNREMASSGGDQFGANLRVENYSVNSLNQYTQRTVPGRVDVLGAARTNGTVTVNLQAAYRKDEYFRTELSADNAANPVWLSVTNHGALKDGANPDITATNIGNVLLAKAVEAFTHDADGNLTSDSLWTNTWNGENRLIAVESASGVASGGKAKETWSHLPDGRWRERVVAYWNGSAYTNAYTNRFVWDRQVLLAVLNHTNGVVTGLMRGLDLSGSHQGAGGVGGVLAVCIATNGVHFAVFDGNGNVSALVGAGTGMVSANYEYSPFGVILRAHGVVSKANPIRWSTQFANDVTGTAKYLFRDYQAGTGRWWSSDPIRERGGMNLYMFVKNNALESVDRLGLVDYRFDPVVGEHLGLLQGAGAWGQPFTHANGRVNVGPRFAQTFIYVWSGPTDLGSCNSVWFRGKAGDNGGAISVYAREKKCPGYYRIYFGIEYEIKTSGPSGNALLNAGPIVESIKAATVTINKKRLISIDVWLSKEEESVFRYDPTISFPTEPVDHTSSGSIDFKIEALREKKLN